LESIVTTISPKGQINIAPIGPQWIEGEEPYFIIRPFRGSTTATNLLATGCAVIHVTDDVLLMAKSACDVVDPTGLGQYLSDTRFWRLNDCHRYFAIETSDVDTSLPRMSLTCRIIASEIVRPYFGLNRAKHACVEAAILATRTHLLDAQSIESELQRLRPLVDKTGGPHEIEAFQWLQQTIHERSQQ
jgi:hypothetical protein